MSMDLEPIDSGRATDPVVSDVSGRLWRVRTRPSNAALDVLLAILVLALVAVLAVAVLL
jgi:hypothetical protein